MSEPTKTAMRAAIAIYCSEQKMPDKGLPFEKFGPKGRGRIAEIAQIIDQRCGLLALTTFVSALASPVIMSAAKNNPDLMYFHNEASEIMDILTEADHAHDD